MTLDREQALQLLLKYNKSQALINHALAVEAVMRYIAKQQGQDPDVWGIVGLMHDLDYEQYPEQHCTKTREILSDLNWPETCIRAIESHGWQICTDVEPKSDMEKTLYAIDELTGLVAATALVRPSKSVMDLTVKSVKKKWKVKSFAAGADRTIIENGAAMLNCEIEELIQNVIKGMQSVHEQIGL